MTCIELDTPQTIMDEGNDFYDEATDIFAEVVTECEITLENAPLMRKALWWRYRDSAIASCDTERWVRGMADRLALIGQRWDDLISKAFEEDMADLTDRSYERTVQRTAIPGTEGDVRTVMHDGSDTTEVSREGSNVHVMEHEALPQTESGATKYLDARQTDTDTPGVTDTTEYTPGVTDTELYTPNTQDKEIFVANDTPAAVTFAQVMQSYPQLLIGFTDEFSQYFINRWYR